MMEGVKNYAYSDTVVMYVVNWYTETGKLDRAVEMLDEAIRYRPDDFRYHWALGLVYSDMDNYPEAIESLKKADELCTEKQPELYYQLGMCFYNIGIDLREAALQINENDEYMKVRDQYLAQFREAVKWLEMAYELEPGSENTITRLYQLYYQLQMKEKQETFEQLMQ
jgi:tetratricopeptide (TPR) repeat protein